jgi:diaminohydroxyphosphoribosylaminopyrimidine deaminase/5-amino-6-(5-phosphoribosylamino)uracil reductase
VEILRAPGTADALCALRARGVRSLLVEGGARLAAELLEHALVDRLVIFQAPIVLGAGGLGAFSCLPARRVAAAWRLRPIQRLALGDDLMTTYALGDLAGDASAERGS